MSKRASKEPPARNQAALAMEAVLAEKAEALTRMMIERAMLGDATAMRLVFGRLMPVGRNRPAPFRLPPLEDAEQARAAVDRIVAAVASGELAPAEAAAYARLVADVADTLAATQGAVKQVYEVYWKGQAPRQVGEDGAPDDPGRPQE